MCAWAAALAAMTLGAGASCELVLGDLPPVHPAADGGGGGSATTTSATRTTSTSGTTGTTSTTGATTTTGVGGSGGAGGCCDCDHDTYPSEALCGGGDCDDSDPDVHPGQTMYFATASKNPNVGFDYDCNGTPDPEFPNPLHCNAIMGADCDAGTGFLGSVPPCGMTGSWGSCVSGSVPLTCIQHVTDPGRFSSCR